VELSSSTLPIASMRAEILRHARAVAQSRRAGVAGARHDLRQAMAHDGSQEVKSPSVTKSPRRAMTGRLLGWPQDIEEDRA
jgi:hypothetical protein